MSSKKASNNSGLCPVKGQKLSLGTQMVPKLILKPVFGYYQDLATIPNAG